MKTSNKQHSKLSSIKMICLVSTVVLLAGLTIFLSIATFGLFQLNQKIKITTDQPFRVSQQVNEIQASLSKMATYSERFLSEHNQAAIDEFRPAYGELYAKIKLTTDKLRKIFKGPEVDIDNFVLSCLQTYESQMNAFSYSEDAIIKDDPWDRPDTDAYHNRIKRTHTEKLIPGYVATNKNLDIILSYAQVEQNEAVRYSDKLMKTTTTWAIIIVFCVSAGLVLFQYIIRRTSRELAIKTRQFDTLSHTIDETFFIFDENSIKTDFVAPNSNKVLGIDFEELKQDRKIIYNYVDEESKQKILAAIKAGDCSETRELIVAYNNPMTSEKRYILMRFYRTLQDNKLKQIVSIMDRTDEIMSQKALQDALITANNANNAKRDFLSRMSHEIRTPMNAIIGMTTIAAASIEDKNKVEDCLSKINYSSKHLLGLINDVLDMSRIESNKLSINNEPFELFEFINSFISIIYPQADQKKIKFSEKMIGFNDNTIYIGDVLRLNQILLNLTSNSMKFTPAGGTITLEISKIPISSHKDTIRFVLTDSGI
ncbi:MAG: histidine kinase dimerization/phospho-acceptor domain-containing protein, partial [Oscillospiraceae bacterium]